MIHLIHSSLLAILLYGIYQLFIKNNGGFVVHRIYLLVLPVVAVILPLLVIPVDGSLVSQALTTPTLQPAAVATLEVRAARPTAVTTTINYFQLGWIIYGVGVTISVLLFIGKLARIAQYKDDGNTVFKDGCFITTVPRLPTAFSFLNRIYIAPIKDEHRLHQILDHEKIHVQQRHSWDLLFYELLGILFWFHPVVYLTQQSLKLVHEHIADQHTIAVYGKQSYYENLLKEALDCPDYSFTNPFFQRKTIKNRMTMIHHAPSHKFPLRKLLWLLPVLLASLTYTACSTEQEIIKVEEKKYRVDDLPTLQDHVYGQIDFYRGVTEDEMKILEEGREIVKKYIGPNTKKDEYYEAFKKMERDPSLNEYRRISSKISDNGKTIVRDIENNNYVLTIHETQNGSPSFTGTGPIDQLNMSSDELSAYLKELHERHGKIENEDIIEDVVEIEEVNSLENIAAVPFAIIENVPTYPGCTGSNIEKKKCMQENIVQLIRENFDTSIANRVGLTGKQTISVQFKIDKNGNVANIMSRAQAPELQAEAARVINLLPIMQPGKQRGQPVNTIYGLPIIFDVAE